MSSWLRTRMGGCAWWRSRRDWLLCCGGSGWACCRPTRASGASPGMSSTQHRRGRTRSAPNRLRRATFTEGGFVSAAGRRASLVALAAIAGPGLLAGLSDDDAPGITTYSIMGARYGYELLWVLALSTVALIVFHEVGSRVGVVTGQGLMGLIRDRYGVRIAAAALAALIVANLGTTCAEFAGVAASLGLLGVPAWVSVPVAAVAVSALVLRGSFHRVERVLLALSTVFAAYILSGILAGPDWSAAARGLVVPSMPLDREAVLTATACLGTTLAPWGLAFIQSYAVDKRLEPKDLVYERVDVITGAVMTGVIGFFVVVACAATLHADGRSIEDAGDAADALSP